MFRENNVLRGKLVDYMVKIGTNGTRMLRSRVITDEMFLLGSEENGTMDSLVSFIKASIFKVNIVLVFKCAIIYIIIHIYIYIYIYIIYIYTCVHTYIHTVFYTVYLYAFNIHYYLVYTIYSIN